MLDRSKEFVKKTASLIGFLGDPKELEEISKYPCNVKSNTQNGETLMPFEADLASTASGKGAGLVGFGTGAVYGSDTAGREIQRINKGRRVTPFDAPFNAKGDHQMVYLGITMAAGSTILTVNSAVFSANDVGKYIFVPRCGPNGYALVTTITAVTSSSQVTLAAASVKGATALHIPLRWGSNDGPALQAMFDYSFETGVPWFIPPGPSGVYLTAQALNVRQCQNTFTNGRSVPAMTWEIDNGATIKACASMDHVIRFGAEDSDYSQFLRDSVIRGGVVDCSFLADIGVDIPFGNVTTIEHNQTKNIKFKGIRFGSLAAPAQSGGNQANFCSSSRDTDYVTVTGITKANPAVVTAPDHNFSNGDVVTLIGVAGMTQANLKFYRIANVTQSTFELVNTDSSGWSIFTGTARVSRCMPSMKMPRFVSAVTRANPCVVTFSQPHGFSNGQKIYLADLGGMLEIGTAAGSVFTCVNVTSTTVQLQGINSTGFGVYAGGGVAIEHVELDNMQVWLWCENAPDVDTTSNQISGVRLGICADPANATGYDGKHVKNHHYNFSEAGEMLAAALLGGDQQIIGCQVDGPFRHAFWWKGQRNQVTGSRINYDPNLPTYDLYATVHRIEEGADLTIIGGGHKAGLAGRLLGDVSGSPAYLWMGVTRVNVERFQNSGWLLASNPVGFGNAIFGAASQTLQSNFTRMVAVGDGVTQTGEFYRKSSTASYPNVSFTSDVGGTESVTCQIMSNGDIRNSNNSYGALSDRRLKENIIEARDYLEDFSKLDFRRYSLKSEQSDEPTQLGLIADEVAQIFPGLVGETPIFDDEGKPTGDAYSSVKYSVVNVIAAKAVQELLKRVKVLEAKTKSEALD